MSRDLSLAIVALAAVIALAVVASIQPPAAEQIITGIVALGSMAIGRVSGANSTGGNVDFSGDTLDDI